MNAETKRRVAACAAGFALPRYRDLPAVGLYLDQTVQYVNACFRTFCGVELTPSMVSNYVKKGILSHPVKKKYTREQIASLMYIVVSKTVLSMENIDTLFMGFIYKINDFIFCYIIFCVIRINTKQAYGEIG